MTQTTDDSNIIDIKKDVLNYISQKYQSNSERTEVFITIQDYSDEAEEYIREISCDKLNFPHCWVNFEVKNQNILRIITLFEELIDEQYPERNGNPVKIQ